jgi:Holliday junction resolvase RusA-like endonuclease
MALVLIGVRHAYSAGVLDAILTVVRSAINQGSALTMMVSTSVRTACLKMPATPTILDLPEPIGVNRLHGARRTGKRRYRTPKYEAWIEEAGWEIRLQKPEPVKGKYHLCVEIHHKSRKDADGTIKAVADLLVTHKLTDDDALCVDVRAFKGITVERGRCRVTFWAAEQS